MFICAVNDLSLFSKYFIYLVPDPTYGKPCKVLHFWPLHFHFSLDNTNTTMLPSLHLSLWHHESTDWDVWLLHYIFSYRSVFRCKPWVPGAKAAQRQQHQRPRAWRCTVCTARATTTAAMNDPPRRCGNRGWSRQLRHRTMRMAYQRVELGLVRRFRGAERDLHAQQTSKAYLSSRGAVGCTWAAIANKTRGM